MTCSTGTRCGPGRKRLNCVSLGSTSSITPLPGLVCRQRTRSPVAIRSVYSFSCLSLPRTWQKTTLSPSSTLCRPLRACRTIPVLRSDNGWHPLLPDSQTWLWQRQPLHCTRQATCRQVRAERQIPAGCRLGQTATMDRAISTPQPIIVNGCETWYNSAAPVRLLLTAAWGGTRDR